MHGSHTDVGGWFDVKFIDIVAFTAHQASISGFASSDDIVIFNLNTTARSQTGAESQAEIIEMSLYKPVDEWVEVFDNLDVPTADYSWAALVCTIFYIMLPSEKAYKWSSYATSSLSSICYRFYSNLLFTINIGKDCEY